MKKSCLFCCLFVYGVFGDTGEVKAVSVMEGESLTLHTDFSEIQTADRILWVFGPENIRIAQFNRAVHKISIYDDVLNGKFRQRLKLDYQTGDLTITNIRTTDSGLYELQIYSGNDVLSRRFSIIVYDPLPVPDIKSDCPQNSSSSSTCVLLCSVMNVTHVTLSWYKGNSLFSSISASDLNIRLSLPLEVEYQDTNTYSCVLNNPIRNQTQHLNITDVCQPCSVKGSGVSEEQDNTILPGVFAGGLLVLAMAAMGVCIYRKCRKTDQNGQASEKELAKLNGADKMKEIKDEVKNIKVKAGTSVKLDTGVTDIQTCDLVQWKFAEVGESTNPFKPISRMNKRELIYQDVNGKLGNRLKLNQESGSLTIENSRTSDSGLYKLEINNSTNQVCKSFFVTVSSGSSFCNCSIQRIDHK